MAPKVITSYKDLETSHESIRDGFLLQAASKTKKALPFIERAKAFHRALKPLRNIDELLKLAEFRDELISAGGFSDKAQSQLTPQELVYALKIILGNILKESKENFQEEIVYRYLLTKGDTLGGNMRNVTGATAGLKLIGAIKDRLKSKNITFQVEASKKDKVRLISWKNRCLFFDFKPKFIDKNVDVILLDTTGGSLVRKMLEDGVRYLACGELKGGIDPAGADEHWKTASSALSRIRACFEKTCPHLFFVGAAIETAMAKEIFAQLENGGLSHAANLNNVDQVTDLVEWLISL